MHGDGFIAGTLLAQVEIECTDCHGTPAAFPWELPLGYGDERAGQPPAAGVPPRGVARELPAHLRRGTVYPPRDGYVLTARGNPFPEIVRDGRGVVVHTAGGQDLRLKPLKLLAQEGGLSLEARVAMQLLDRHVAKLECYTCHATWAPQCYGCHLKIDYSQGKKELDWVAAGQRHREPAHAADRGEADYPTFAPGATTEERSYLRFEDPMLGVNGEGRVTPLIPGCQAAVTVIGFDGRTVLKNHVFRTPPGTAGSGAEGQLSLDMSPVQPHTMGHARSCMSCHGSEKAMGYGIGERRMVQPWSTAKIYDAVTADGRPIARSVRPQMEPIPGLDGDWSRIVTRDGKQLMTVGHHYPGSRPLDNHERAMLDRHGVCVACHQAVPRGSLSGDLLHHVGQVAGLLPTTDADHARLVSKALTTAAWAQLVLPLVLALGAAVGARLLLRRWRRRRRGATGSER